MALGVRRNHLPRSVEDSLLAGKRKRKRKLLLELGVFHFCLLWLVPCYTQMARVCVVC